MSELPLVPGGNADAALVAPELLERLSAYAQDAAGAYASNSTKGIRSDLNIYARWCRVAGMPLLPATVEQLGAFIAAQIAEGKRRATLEHYLFTLRLLHDAAGVDNPVRSPRWDLRWKALRRGVPKVQRQAVALTTERINTVLEGLGDTPRERRDAALICVAADSALRIAALARIQVDDLVFAPEGTATVFVPHDKEDQEGEGKFKALSPETVAQVRAWLAERGDAPGALFVALGGRPRRRPPPERAGPTAMIEEPERVPGLLPQEIARIFKRRARVAGVIPIDLSPSRRAGRRARAPTVSGHSTRVGAVQDLIAAGMTAEQIKQITDHQSDVMIARYGAQLLAERSSMVELRRTKPLGGRRPAPDIPCPEEDPP
jgi:integrase